VNHRKQEKTGWIAGWSGGFIWVLIPALIFFTEARYLQAWTGLIIIGAALAAILLFSPWRNPRVSYRRLMTPIYLLIFVAIAWGVWASGGLRQMGINSWWTMLVLLPVLIPWWTIGRRRWDENDS